jgi:hypothetical protein
MRTGERSGRAGLFGPMSVGYCVRVLRMQGKQRACRFCIEQNLY